MRNLFWIIILLSISLPGLTHPGIGIVKDSKGNIFYTDLKQVWKISTDGKKTIVVHHVHTHELYMDANDNLYGEHLWYNGEKLNTWGHYAWCLYANGRLDTLVGPKQGFLENYSFVRDRVGNMYWAERFKVTRIKMKSPDGKITTIAEGKFKDIRWMYSTAKGTVYFMDLVDLYKIEPGKAPELIAENLSSNKSLLSMATDSRHDIMGIWTDKEDNIYVANMSGQVVKKISGDGSVTKIAFSTAPWSPTGGIFDNNGDLWLLEYSTSNEARVRKIPASELGQQSNVALREFNSNILPPLMLIGFVCTTTLLIIAGIHIARIKLNLK